jgi:hypothetical protein
LVVAMMIYDGALFVLCCAAMTIILVKLLEGEMEKRSDVHLAAALLV